MDHSNVLVTGSSGVIGTSLVESLLDHGCDVTGVDIRPNRWSEAVDRNTIQLDLTNHDVVDQLPDEVDTVVHLAANSRVLPSVENPEEALENVESTLRVLEYARDTNARLITASSREVYGVEDGPVYDETDVDIGTTKNPYAASKVSTEAFCGAFAASYDLDYCAVRLSNVYGRYDLDRVIPIFVARSLAGKPLKIYGEQKLLDFLYIDDCITGIRQIMQNFSKVSGMSLNLASGSGTSLGGLANRITDITDSDSEIRRTSNRTGEVNRFVADVSRAKHILDYEPTFTLTEGLRETVDWYETRADVRHEILA